MRCRYTESGLCLNLSHSCLCLSAPTAVVPGAETPAGGSPQSTPAGNPIKRKPSK
jgi:hypothetical protein